MSSKEEGFCVYVTMEWIERVQFLVTFFVRRLGGFESQCI